MFVGVELTLTLQVPTLAAFLVDLQSLMALHVSLVRQVLFIIIITTENLASANIMLGILSASNSSSPSCTTARNSALMSLFSTAPNLPPGDCPRLRLGHILRHCARYKSTYYYYYYKWHGRCTYGYEGFFQAGITTVMVRFRSPCDQGYGPSIYNIFI